MVMASLHNGRRAALIPSIDSLSPAELQDILRNRIGRPVIPPPNSCLALFSSEGRTGPDKTSKLHRAKQPESEGIIVHSGPGALQQDDSTRTFPGSRSSFIEPLSVYSRRLQPGKEGKGGQLPRQEMFSLYQDHKRKHAVYARDEQRRYSEEILEDIPHMSEIDSDDGFRIPHKDVFGSKGQQSLFHEV